MFRFGLSLIVALVIVSCASNTPAATDDSSLLSQEPNLETPLLTTVDEAQLSFTVDDVVVSLPHPIGWEFYETAYGIVLAERIGSVATDGQLDGLLMHVFVPPLDGLNINVQTNNNLAWDALRQIIANKDYIGTAAVSDPQAFSWDGHHAAYYLMNNGQDNRTIVIGVVAPSTNRLVTSSISAPVGQVDRIREALPNLLNNLTINGVRIDGLSLEALPTRLDFPTHPEAPLTKISS